MASADILRAAHTSLPWTNPELSVQICSEGELILADCVGEATSRKTDEANAAFIVRACNAHYQMLEALKAAQAALAMMVSPHVIGTTSSSQAWATCFEAEVKARAAIAAAGAEAGR